jgi:hypothetical protein
MQVKSIPFVRLVAAQASKLQFLPHVLWIERFIDPPDGLVTVGNHDKGLAVCPQHHRFQHVDVRAADRKILDSMFFFREHALGGPGGNSQA